MHPEREQFEPREPRRQGSPDKEYFEQDGRSAELRDIVIGITDDLSAISRSEGRDADALGSLMDRNARLAEMGIEPEMHKVSRDDPDAQNKKDRLMSDPVTTAEWIAGQARAVIEFAGLDQEGTADLAAEHDISEGNVQVARLIDAKAMPKGLRHSYIDQQAITILRSFIDYDAGRLDLDQAA